MGDTKLLDAAIKHHKEGRLDLAEDIYNELISLDERDFNAYHLLANIKNQRSDFMTALRYVNIAIDLNRCSDFINTRGMILLNLGRLVEAHSEFNAALKLNSNNVEAINNLAIVYKQQGKIKKSIEYAEKAINIRPNFVCAWINLGAAHQDFGEYQTALDSFNKALELDPNNIVVMGNLCRVNYLMGKIDDAYNILNDKTPTEAIPLDLTFILADIEISRGDYKLASDRLVSAFDHGLDNVLLEKILANNQFFNVLYHVCNFCSEVHNDKNKAYQIYKLALDYSPADKKALIFVNLSNIFFSLHRIDDAIDMALKATKDGYASPDVLATSFSNLGVYYISKGESAKAIEYLELALSINPKMVQALGWLLKEKSAICDWNGYQAIKAQLDDVRTSGGNLTPVAPFGMLAVYNDPQILKYWAELTAVQMFDATSKRTDIMNLPVKLTESAHKIRIGYYSYDFRNHPVAHLTCRLFELHDRDKFELFIYSYGPDDGSEVRKRIKKTADHFVELSHLSVVDTAKRIAEDEIDFLIDLTGVTLHTRSEVFALRPARVQAHWLGFLGTLGSPCYDYIITDEIMTPVAERQFYDENFLYLDSGFHVADDSRVINPGLATRGMYDLAEDAFVFGCFSQTFKIQPEIFEAWMKILKSIPNSILWLANGPPLSLNNLKLAAERHGVDPVRLVVSDRCGMEEYLARFSVMDLYLDAFPYTSGTVASDALFGGCPLLTLSGRTMVSRNAASILTHAGLPEFVATTMDDYVHKAVDLANNRDVLKKAKHHLLQKRDGGSLLRTIDTVKSLEKAVAYAVGSK